MNLKFSTITKKGKGRGKQLGFPTVNLVIPDTFTVTVTPGIYAAKTTIKDVSYKAALYFGTIPTFDDSDYSLELYLLDTSHLYVAEGQEVTFEIIKFIRGVQKFDSPELLVIQMDKDVKAVKSVLSNS